MKETKEYGSIVISNVFWKFAEKIGAQFVSFVITVILARIIEPEAYGVVAIISVFISILSVFIDSGFGNALIQKKDADDLDFSSVFYANAILCLIVYFLLFICAPLISNFYEIPSMAELLRVSGLTIIVSSLKNVQDAYISKNMMFKKFFFASLIGTIIAGIIGIVLAINNYGVWSLIISSLIDNVVDTLIISISIKWKPKLMFSFERVKALFGYGSKLLLSNILNKIYEDTYQLVIGKFHSTSELAYYNKADNLPSKITTNINNSINSVLMPVMSNNQDDKEKVKEIMKTMMKTSFYIINPLLIGLIATAEPVVMFALGSKWMPIVPYMRLICVIRIFRPLHTANLIAIKSQGRSDIFLKQEIIKKVITILTIIIMYNRGVYALTCSMLVVDFIEQIINSYPNKKLINYSYFEQIKDLLPIFLLGIIMGLAVYLLSFIKIESIIIQLFILIASGAVMYIGLSIIFKLDSFYYVLDIICNIINKRKRTNE